MRSSGRCHLGIDLDLLLDDCLDAVRRDTALAHVAGCDLCRHELEAARAVRGRLRALADAPPVPPALTARLLAIAADGVATGQASARSGHAPLHHDEHAGGSLVSRPPAGGYLPVWRPHGVAPARGARERAVLLAGGALSVAGLALAAAGTTPLDRPGLRTTVIDPGRPGSPAPVTARAPRPRTISPASADLLLASFQPQSLRVSGVPVSSGVTDVGRSGLVRLGAPGHTMTDFGVRAGCAARPGPTVRGA